MTDEDLAALRQFASQYNQSQAVQAPLSNPAVDQDKVQAAKIIATQIKRKPSDVYDNLDTAIELQSGKKQSASSFVQKTQNYIKNTDLDRQINRINGMYPFGPLPPEAQAQVDELEKQKQGDTLEGAPKVGADIISGIGTFAGDIETKADALAEALSEDFQGLVASGLQTMGVEMNPDTAQYHFNLGLQQAREFTAEGIGAAKKAARAEGEGETSSLITAEVLDLGNTLMLGFPAGAAKDAVEVAFANTVLKSGLKGGLVRAGKVVTRQMSFAAAASAWNNMIDQFGTELSNVAEKTHIPLKSIQDQAKEIGFSTVTMAAGGSALEGAGIVAGKIMGIADRARGKSAPEAENQVKAIIVETGRIKHFAVEFVRTDDASETGKPDDASETGKPDDASETGKPDESALELQREAQREESAYQEISKKPYEEEEVPRGTSEMAAKKPPPITEEVESDPAVVAARKMADENPENLKYIEALDSARKEAHMNAIEHGKIRVANDRARARVRAEDNEWLDDIRHLKTDKLPEEYKKPIQELLDKYSTKNPRQSTLSALAEVKKQVDAGTAAVTLPEKYVSRLDELSKTPFRKLSHEDFKIVYDTIMAYHQAGVESRTLLEEGQRVDKEQALAALKTEIDKTHPKESGVPDEYIPEKKGISKKATQTVNYVKNCVSQYQTMISRAFGGEDSRGYKILGKPIDDGEDIKWTKHYEYRDPITQWFTSNKLDMSDWLNEKKKVDVDGFKGELTRGNIIALGGIAAQEEGRASLLDGGFALPNDREKGKFYHLTEDSLDKLLSSMEPKEKEFLQKIFDLGSQTGKDMKPTFRRMYGYDTEWLDNYYPLYRAKHELPAEEEILHQRSQQFFNHAGVDKSHTIERLGSKNAVWLRNAGQDVMDIIDTASTFVGLAEPVRNASKVLFDSDFGNHVKNTMGDTAYRMMKEGLQAIAGNKKLLDAPSRWWINIRNRGIGAVLGFNLQTGGINRILVERSLAGYIPAGDWSKGQAMVALHPRSSHDYLVAKSTLYRQIHEGGMLPEMHDLSMAQKGLGKIQKAAMLPEKAGFTGAIKGEMWSAITQVRREMQEGKASPSVQRALGLGSESFPSMNEDQKAQAEIKYAEYVVKRTHANPREMYRQNFTREGIIGLTLSTLMSEKNALLNLGIRKAIDIHTPGGGKAFAKYLVVGVFGESLAIAGIRAGVTAAGAAVNTLITGKETKKKQQSFTARAIDELAQNTIGLVPGVAQVTYPIERALSGNPNLPIQVSQDLVSQFGDDIIKTIQHTHTAMTAKSQKAQDKAWGDAFDSFMSWSVPLSFNIPYKHGLGDVVGEIRNMTQ